LRLVNRHQQKPNFLFFFGIFFVGFSFFSIPTSVSVSVFHSELTGTGGASIFLCDITDVVKDTGKEEYLRPFIRIGLDS